MARNSGRVSWNSRQSRRNAPVVRNSPRVVRQRTDELGGSFRITASIFTAIHHVPAIVADLRVHAPEIDVEITASVATENI